MTNTISIDTHSPFRSKTHGSEARLSPSDRADDANRAGVDLTSEKLNIHEVLFDDLKAADTLIVQTRNSTYTFLVMDAADRLGKLTGGALQTSVLDARLVSVDSNKLKVGSTAVFLTESSSGVKRLSTSPIVLLSYEKYGDR